MRGSYFCIIGMAALLASCGGTDLKPQTAPVAPVAQPPAQQPDPNEIHVKQVLDTASYYFDQGENEYKSGHLEKARQNYDTCIDAFLLSGITASKEPRLAEALDSYLTRIHKRELEAFQEGDGFTGVPVEPAQIDELETPVEEPPKVAETTELIQKIEGEIDPKDYDIPVVVNSKVLAFISMFQHVGRNELEGGIARSGRYLPMIRAIFKEEGIPQDLAYMALIESAFKTHAYSRAAAMGMWQFIAGTGRRYNLRNDWWVDERCDPEKATRAAAGYLKDLYATFGDWYLSMAAYNTGEAMIGYCLQRSGKKTFWELADSRYLRVETRNYVPAILAAMLIAKNQEKYGFNVPLDEPVDSTFVKIPATTDLRLIAECADTTLASIQDLNPELRRLTTPKGVADYPLRLPAASVETFTANFAAIPTDKRVTWRLRTVDRGDTLIKLASLYGTSVSSIVEANSLKGTDLVVGSKLVIPMGPRLIAQVDPAPAPAYSGRANAGGTYTVRSGDSLYTIARASGVSVQYLMQRNGLRSQMLHPGDKLYTSPTAVVSKPASGYEKVVYLVKQGDTLYNIASNYNTTIDSIRNLNGLTPSSAIRPGDRLTIYRGKK